MQQHPTKSPYIFLSFIINLLNSKIFLNKGLQSKDTIQNFTSPTAKEYFSKFLDLSELIFLFLSRLSASYNLVLSLPWRYIICILFSSPSSSQTQFCFISAHEEVSKHFIDSFLRLRSETEI